MLPKLGRYETLKKIASGGMATVYLGRVVGEGGFERLVALKVMHPHIASDPDFVGMFLDEARLAARIRHPNVVATLDIQKTDDAMFLVMDYVDGPTLQETRKHLRARDERIPVPIALRIFIDILNGLQEAHDLRDKDGKPLHIVHRDVSPHNVLIGQDGRAQLTDFGVAKAEARISSTRGGQLKGKIAYMPPEQIVAQPVTAAADVYSAGVCLWEALVGKRLFRAPNDGALVHMILEGKPASLSKYCDDIAPALEGVIMKAISRRAEDRYATALEFAEALEDAAREANIRVPKQREVAKFIRSINDELGKNPVSKRSLTPPSQPNVQLQQRLSSEGSAPSNPSGGSQPSAGSRPAGGSRPKPPVASSALTLPGPPPIPDIGSEPGRSAPSRPKRLPPRATKSAPIAKAAPRSKEGAPPPRAPAPSEPVIEDPPTEVMHDARPATPAPAVVAAPPRIPEPITEPAARPADETANEPASDMAMADLVHSSQPSGVTSPTQTAAIYSPEVPPSPPPSRHGVIAVAVSGVFALIVIIAVMVGSPSSDSEPGPAAPLPLPRAKPEPSSVVDPTPPPRPAPSPSPSATQSATAAPSYPSPPRSSGGIKPPSPPPPTGSQFKPKEL